MLFIPGMMLGIRGMAETMVTQTTRGSAFVIFFLHLMYKEHQRAPQCLQAIKNSSRAPPTAQVWWGFEGYARTCNLFHPIATDLGRTIVTNPPRYRHQGIWNATLAMAHRLCLDMKMSHECCHICRSTSSHICRSTSVPVCRSFVPLTVCPPLALLSFSLKAGAVPPDRHETQPFPTKWTSNVKNWGKIAILNCPRQPFRTKWGSIVKNWGKFAILRYRFQPFRTKWTSMNRPIDFIRYPLVN